MSALRPWLADFTWGIVTAQNSVLCQAKNALHRPASDGHEATKELWQARHRTEMRLDEAVDLCRRCHRMAPFCFYNRNTFTAIIRDVVMKLDQARVVRSHIVAGVATEEEERAFRKFCEHERFARQSALRFQLLPPAIRLHHPHQSRR